jgi:hypothetical protein
MKLEARPREFPVPEELKEKLRNDPRFKRAFEARARPQELLALIGRLRPLSAKARPIG